MKPLSILGISGSLRRHSTNTGLLRYAQTLANDDWSLEIANLSQIPFYSEDITKKPEPVIALLNKMKQADAFLFACPEYNYSIAPALKNALDWASREPNNTLLAGKPAALLGAGGGMGSSRAQYHLRQVCVGLDLRLLNKPEIFSNAFGDTFSKDGTLVDPRIQGLVNTQLNALFAWAHTLQTKASS